MTPPVEQCVHHSGISKAIENLEDFRERQEGKEGVNQRIFERLDAIGARLNWVLGGIALLGFLLTLMATQIKLH